MKTKLLHKKLAKLIPNYKIYTDSTQMALCLAYTQGRLDENIIQLKKIERKIKKLK